MMVSVCSNIFVPYDKISHTFRVSLIVRLASNTRTSDTAHGLATLLRSSSKAEDAFDGLHGKVVID
jgi:hypothetical protein